jgi:tetratricopeptide (TPR) repeat protein
LPAFDQLVLRLEVFCLYDQGDYQSVLQKAAELLNSSTIEFKFVSYQYMGMASLRLGRMEAAKFNLEQALNLALDFNSPRLVAKVRLQLAFYSLIQGNPKEALNLVKLGLPEHIRINLLMDAVTSYWLLSLLSEEESERVENSQLFYQNYANLPESGKTLHELNETWLSPYLDLKVYSKLFVNNQFTKCTEADLGVFRGNKEQYRLFLDFNSNLFFYNGEELKLKRRTVLKKLLQYLCEHSNEELDLENIFKSVWGKEYDMETDSYTVRTNIMRLREALKDTTYDLICSKESRPGLYLLRLCEQDCVIFNNSSK